MRETGRWLKKVGSATERECPRHMEAAELETFVLFCFASLTMSLAAVFGQRDLSQVSWEACEYCRRLKGNRSVLEPVCDKDEAIVHSSSLVSKKICFPWSAMNTLHYSPLCVLGATYTSALFLSYLVDDRLCSFATCFVQIRFVTACLQSGSVPLRFANTNIERAVLLVHASCQCLP